MATKQVIEIDVTWDSYGRKLNLNSLLAWVAGTETPIKRITIREKKNGR